MLRSVATLSLALVAASVSVSAQEDLQPHNFTVPRDVFTRQLQQNPEFDIYVLQMYWWTGHCAASGTGIPLCNTKTNKPPAAWDQQLVVHGLWPSYSDEYRTQKKLQVAGPDGLKDKCTGAAYVAPVVPGASQASTSKTTKKGKAPAATTPSFFVNLKGDKSGTPSTVTDQVIFPGRGVSATHPDFYKHEYEKHGKCSGLSQTQYFAQSVALGNQMNAKIRALNFGTAKTVKFGELQKAAGFDSSVVACNSARQLWFINFCFEHDGKGKIGAPTRCPALNGALCVTKDTKDQKNAAIPLR